MARKEIDIREVIREVVRETKEKAVFAEMLLKLPVHQEKWAFEGIANQLKSGITMSDLRRDTPQRNAIKPNTIIEANCVKDGEIVLLYTIDSIADLVYSMPRPPLLLDGFISPKAAESRMHDFYPDWSEKTLGRMTTFITIKNLLQLRGNQQKL